MFFNYKFLCKKFINFTELQKTNFSRTPKGVLRRNEDSTHVFDVKAEECDAVFRDISALKQRHTRDF